MSYAAILFDMDGVVIDTHRSVTEFWEVLAAELGTALSQADFEQHIYGCPAHHTFATLFPELGQPQKAAIMEQLQAYELNLAYTAVPGVKTLLQGLQQHQIPTALVTSGDRWKVRAVERQLGLHGLFTTYVTINDVRHGKPAPDAYLLAAQRLDKSLQSCLVFEDAVSGVMAAVAAGASCIGVQPVARLAAALQAAGASCTIPDFTALHFQAIANPDDRREMVLYLQLDSGPSFLLTN
jgi:HAD superfamily hydrolase (TIGR01509 family)